MYPSISNDNQKHTPPLDPTTQSSQFGVSPPPPQFPTAPPLPSETSPSIATGIPISSTNQFFPPNGSTVFQRQTHGPVPWSTGLCQCSEDIGNCCVTCWCPCITFGKIAEIVDEGSPSCEISGALYTLILCLTGCSCLYSCFYRSKLRKQYWLEESPCPDCLVHCFCGHCALCQEYRELKNSGFDMSIGWKANLDKQNIGVVIPPVIARGMNR